MHSPAKIPFLVVEDDGLIRLDLVDTLHGGYSVVETARRVFEAWPECKITVISGRHNPSPDRFPKSARFLRKL